MTDSYPYLYELAQKRYSCRLYTDRRPDTDLITAILDIARLAPSAVNRQPWHFLVADTVNPDHEQLIQAIYSSYERDWIRTAPIFIIACGDHSAAWHRKYDGKDHTDIDLSIAIEHICMAAASLDLGSCWVCNFNPEPIRTAFGLPEHIEPIAIIPVGYPADETRPKNRKQVSEIVKWGKF